MKRPWLKQWMKPLSEWYANAAGYRKLGLRVDDLIPEESDVVMLALKRLPPKEAYDRVFRLRRAFQVTQPSQLGPLLHKKLQSLTAYSVRYRISCFPKISRPSLRR
ncbi:MAG: hypothetical protein Q9174_000306 [Haloplaca sp. 1 TL-2023]